MSAEATSDVGADGLKHQAVRGVAWGVASFGGNRFIGFVATLVLARLLVPEEFGVAAAGLALVTFLQVALDVGLGAALVYEQEEGISDRVRTAFTLNLLLSGGLASLFLVAAPWVAAFFQVPDEAGVFRLLAAWLVVRGLSQVHEAVLKRDLRFRARASVEVVRAATRAGVMVLLALGGFGAASVLIGYVVAEAVAAIMLLVMVRVRPVRRIDRVVLGSFMGYGSWLFVAQVLDEVRASVDYLIIGNALGPEELGYYSVAYRIPGLVIAASFWVFSSVAFPVYARARTEGQAMLADIVVRSLRVTSLFGLTAGVGLAVISDDAIDVMFGPRWAPAAAPMALVSVGLGMQAVGFAVGDLLKATGRVRFFTMISGVTAVLAVGGFLAVAPYGLTAVAGVHVVVGIVEAAIFAVIARRVLSVPLGDLARAIAPGVAAALGIVLVSLPVQMTTDGVLGLVGTVLAGVVGAAVVLWAFGRSTLDELVGLARSLRR